MRVLALFQTVLLAAWASVGETRILPSATNVMSGASALSSGAGLYRPAAPAPGTSDETGKMGTISHENFEMPKPFTERYMANRPTDSGGLFTESFSLHHCHQRKIKTGKCNDGCFDKIPGSGNCFVYSADDECLCIDPCRLFGDPKLDKVSGDTLPGSGCESCVRHKSHNYFDYRNVPGVRPTRNYPRLRPSWVYSTRKEMFTLFDVQCGMCENRCVAASKTGPKFEAEECVGEWKWKLSDCRRMDVTQEQLTEAGVDIGSGSSEIESHLPGSQDKTEDGDNGSGEKKEDA
eukprot:g8675.t1